MLSLQLYCRNKYTQVLIIQIKIKMQLDKEIAILDRCADVIGKTGGAIVRL